MDVFQRINKMYQVAVAEIEREMLAYCLKGIKMIKLSTGVEVSEETVISALKKAGISVEPKHIFRAGDVAIPGTSTDWRFIINVGGHLRSVNKNGFEQGVYEPGKGQEHFEKYNYKYVGRQSDLIRG